MASQKLGNASRLSAFIHWVRVAAEIAKISDNPMDMEVMKSIVGEEERLMRGGAHARQP